IRDPDAFAAPIPGAVAEPRPTSVPPSPAPREPAPVRSLQAPRSVPLTTTRGPLPLGAELARLPLRELQAMAQRVLRAELPEQAARLRLTAALTERPYLGALLSRLDPRAPSLLDLLALLGGVATTAELEGLALRSGRSPGSLREDAALLERHGLLFRAVSPLQPIDAGKET